MDESWRSFLASAHSGVPGQNLPDRSLHAFAKQDDGANLSFKWFTTFFVAPPQVWHIGARRLGPTEQERRQWEEYVTRTKTRSIDIPYSRNVYGAQVTGVLHVRDQIMEMSTEGVVIGAVNGTYELSIDHYEVYIYDPTGVLARLLLQLDFVNLEFRGRLDTRRLDGGWSEGDWVIFWRA